MKTEFSNRLLMFDSSLGVLQNPDRKPVWFQKDPMAFTGLPQLRFGQFERAD